MTIGSGEYNDIFFETLAEILIRSFLLGLTYFYEYAFFSI
jgi:hypothetical protein